MITFRTVVSWLAQDLAGRMSTERLQVNRTEQEAHSDLPTWNWIALETVTLLQQYPGVLFHGVILCALLVYSAYSTLGSGRDPQSDRHCVQEE